MVPIGVNSKYSCNAGTKLVEMVYRPEQRTGGGVTFRCHSACDSGGSCNVVGLSPCVSSVAPACPTSAPVRPLPSSPSFSQRKGPSGLDLLWYRMPVTARPPPRRESDGSDLVDGPAFREHLDCGGVDDRSHCDTDTAASAQPSSARRGSGPPSAFRDRG